jgi:small subunit ribosomal protein S3
MGQKVNPKIVRLGGIYESSSKWFTDSKTEFANNVISDFRVRSYLQKKYSAAGVSNVQIQRLGGTMRVIMRVARSGIILGKKGGDVEILRKELSKLVGIPVHVSIEEVKKPDLDAKLVAESIAQQLERRIMFRKAMKRAVQSALKNGALGVKTSVAGRLGGAEIARTEWYREGRVPLHTFRADIDYGFAEANTTYGIIGVKVWIFKGEIFGKQEETPEVLIEEVSE